MASVIIPVFGFVVSVDPLVGCRTGSVGAGISVVGLSLKSGGFAHRGEGICPMGAVGGNADAVGGNADGGNADGGWSVGSVGVG
jgi:hypothetical protein